MHAYRSQSGNFFVHIKKIIINHDHSTAWQRSIPIPSTSLLFLCDVSTIHLALANSSIWSLHLICCLHWPFLQFLSCQCNFFVHLFSVLHIIWPTEVHFFILIENIFNVCSFFYPCCSLFLSPWNIQHFFFFFPVCVPLSFLILLWDAMLLNRMLELEGYTDCTPLFIKR